MTNSRSSRSARVVERTRGGKFNGDVFASLTMIVNLTQVVF